MSGDMMPKEQYDFIKGIQDNMLEASNMTEADAWRFGFLLWQHQEWIRKYLADRKTEPQKMCDADCNEDCTECAKEWQDWKDQMWTEAVIEPQTERSE